MSLLKSLKGENSGPPPVWFMRQAGRYMPQYRALREKHSFLTMIQTPEIATEVTLMPIRQLGVDAAILFCDILVILETLGVKYHFKEGLGPVIESPLHHPDDVLRLPTHSPQQTLSYVSKAIHLTKSALTVPLIGFCGAPFTIASYLIEGGGSKDFKKTKKWLFEHPESFHKLLDKITDLSIDYLKMQKKSGVDALQVFDTWAGILGYSQFLEFSLPYLTRICEALSDIPVILFCKGSSVFADDLVKAKPAAISLDWHGSLSKVRRSHPKLVLQGNLDPDVLYAPKEKIRQEACTILDQMKGDPAYIFNLGHGIKPDMSVDAVRFLVECVKN
jgi:uroporphyrinogen decarboxylase